MSRKEKSTPAATNAIVAPPMMYKIFTPDEDFSRLLSND
jgi:hypothetical protein